MMRSPALKSFLLAACTLLGSCGRELLPSPEKVLEQAAASVVEYTPAPGQFINESYSPKDASDAARWADARLAEGLFVSLGAFGGYLVAEFEKPVENDGGWNFAIRGNSSAGSSEPGVVWVMKDENGNGRPDDRWYEIAGSEHGCKSTLHDYTITYTRPDGGSGNIIWTASGFGREKGIIEINGYHNQSYWPEWVGDGEISFTGTRLPLKAYDESGNGSNWVLPGLGHGYADNHCPEDAPTLSMLANPDFMETLGSQTSLFRISDAVDHNGNPADLDCIDFVKVQTGVNGSCGWMGEISTEICGIWDFNMLKK
ncbi:MAG: hypothetical protein HUJ94_04015 [Bacteroidales bacterium]|nr:hypothetical protein [Bacteroidales bacterium]